MGDLLRNYGLFAVSSVMSVWVVRFFIRRLFSPNRTSLSIAIDTILEIGTVFEFWIWGQCPSMNYNLQIAKRFTNLVDCGPCKEDLFVERVDGCRNAALAKSKLQYSPGGKLLYFQGNLGRMIDKLRFIDYLKRHPDIEKVKMKCPVFIVGFPRTGTTLLHEILNAHPNVQEPRCWEQLALTPTIDNESLLALETDRKKRYAANKPEFTFAFKWVASNRIQNIHRIEYDLPEEDTILMGTEMPLSLTDFPLMVIAANEFLPLGASSTYIQYRKMLQLLTWQVEARRDKDFTWILKSPFHLPYLDELLTAFPNSPIVWTHRDPIEAIPSACTLFENCLLFVMEEWSIDRHLLGKAVMEYSLLTLKRALKFVDEHEKDINLLHIRYADLVRDPKEICRKILKQASLPYTQIFEERADAYLHQNSLERERMKQKNKSTTVLNPYSPEDYGLTSEEIRYAFAAYIQRFQL